MSSRTKTLWVAMMASICGLGLFLAHHEDATARKNRPRSAELRLSVRLIEAQVRAVYPDFRAAQKIEAGLRQTINTSSFELCVTDINGTRYICSAIRSLDDWKIEQVRRLRSAARGRLI